MHRSGHRVASVAWCRSHRMVMQGCVVAESWWARRAPGGARRPGARARSVREVGDVRYVIGSSSASQAGLDPDRQEWANFMFITGRRRDRSAGSRRACVARVRGGIRGCRERVRLAPPGADLFALDWPSSLTHGWGPWRDSPVGGSCAGSRPPGARPSRQACTIRWRPVRAPRGRDIAPWGAVRRGVPPYGPRPPRRTSHSTSRPPAPRRWPGGPAGRSPPGVLTGTDAPSGGRRPAARGGDRRAAGAGGRRAAARP